jgi:hypothetical protein
MRRIASPADAAATEQAKMTVYEGPEKELVTRIAAFVQKRAAELVNMATPMLKVDLWIRSN